MILTTTTKSVHFDLIEHNIADLPEVTYHRYLCESTEELCQFLEECSRVVAVVSIGPVTGELTECNRLDTQVAFTVGVATEGI